MALTRRQVVAGAAVGGGLLVALAVVPRHFPLPTEPGPGEVTFDAWLRIGRDGTITLSVPQLEMGQGVLTVLAQIAAVELGADWRQIAVEMAPVSEIWANIPLAARWVPLWAPLGAPLGAPWLARALGDWPIHRWAQDHRFMDTADGMSVPAYEGAVRAAAAGARAMLAMTAARRWGVAWEQCEVAGGRVLHTGRSLPFGPLAEAAARLTPPNPPVLRPLPAAESPAAFPAGAQPAFPRLDLPAKVDGTWPFAADIRLPGMVFAAIRHAPHGAEASLATHDAARAKGIAGFERLVVGPHWLAAVASHWWAAERALSAIAPHFAVHRPVDSGRIDAALDTAVKRGDAHRVAGAGDAAGLLGDHPQFSARYDMAPALHATLETASATARLRDGRVEIWIATQSPEHTRMAVAEALGVAHRDVLLYPLAAGGSFDARLDTRHAAQVALIAQAVGKPVQLTWSRWQEHVAGLPRAPMAAVVSARADTSGGIAAWRLRAAMPATTREFARRHFDGASARKATAAQDLADPMALDGAVPPYGIAHVAIDHVPVAITLPTGRMRGQGHAMAAFITECFVDEIATALHREPLSFRMAMLEADPRLAQCLQRVSALAGWNGGQDGSGAGLACHRMGGVAAGGCIAAIATARRSEQGVRVDRITAVADIGRIINADIARQQIEGGLIYGIGLAIGASTGFVQGLPTNGRLGQLNLPVLGDCPEVEVELIASSADPFDPGELGVAVAAPAIANALFSATGLRFRRLPLSSDE